LPLFVIRSQLSNPNPDGYQDGHHYAIWGGCQILPKKLEARIDLYSGTFLSIMILTETKL